MLPPVYMLVCDEIPGRRAAAEAHLKDRNVSATFWRGFHGVTWGLETSKEYDPGKRLPPGHVGLNAGSWAMWQAAYVSTDWAAGYHPTRCPIVFLEDDAVLPEGFEEKLETVQNDLSRDFPDWDLVFIGTCGQEPGIWHKVTERIGGPDSRLCRLDNPFGTHAMMVRRRAIPVLLEHMRAAERNLDQQLWQRVLQPGHLKWCAVLPTLVTQRTYDHAGTGTPEWAPSTLRPGEEPKREPVKVETGDLPGRPSAETTYASLAVVDPYACIYRGEMLADHGRMPEHRGSVPLSECARLNRPCHSKRGDRLVVDAKGNEAVACEKCPHRLEMAPSTHRDRLPLPEGHFNPSMIMWQGKLVLATRDSWGHSKVALWELENEHPNDWQGGWFVKPIGSYGSDHKLAPRLEDPRLFVADGPNGRPALHSMFSLPDGYPPRVVKVGYVRFADDLSGIEETKVLSSPHGNLYEKNWMPIWNAERRELCWAYSYKPEHVVYGWRDRWSTPNPFPWTGGALRGGATPVLSTLSDEYGRSNYVYYHFFHGCLKRPQGSVYTMGCNVFEAKPPYRVLRQTPVPLLWPDLPAPGENVVKRSVVFPGGAVPHAGAWHICLGIDDTFCRIVRLPFADVEAALKDVPEERNVSSIRETHIVNGVKPGEFK